MMKRCKLSYKKVKPRPAAINEIKVAAQRKLFSAS
eukprot:CAMPEP_0168351108 /NCGR_PEP_ID=MMETSP0213-20121227/21608_1 /TAXON_ID=151035 /ORGANISM="Euplotes harpa, Strain FSP1.4" /LENGTH=34 /DNA_ID= /DNA_START= /DNA_END= /DNA_ORIENTATION=